MAILITGGEGFIGSRVVSFLEKNGRDVILFEGDVSNKKNVDNFKPEKKIETVIHLAAVVNKKDKEIFRKVNVDGTKNIIEFSQKNNIRRLIFLSTIRVLSKTDDPYINSKKEAEKAVVGSGLPYVIIRPSMAYGSGDEKNLGFLLNIAKKMPIMPVLNFRTQPVFVDDLVKIIASSLNMNDDVIINVVGTEIISFKEILLKLKSLKYKFKIINMPNIFSILIKIFSLLPFSPLPYWQVRGLLNDEIFSGDDWPKVFNIKPTPFEIYE